MHNFSTNELLSLLLHWSLLIFNIIITSIIVIITDIDLACFYIIERKIFREPDVTNKSI